VRLDSQKLYKLHNLFVDSLLSQLEASTASGKYLSSADKSVIAKFLKDNEITVYKVQQTLDLDDEPRSLAQAIEQFKEL